MSQFGMQMPGGKAARGSTPDVYTSLMFVAIGSMITACVLLWFAGARVSPTGMPFDLQEPGGAIELKN